MQNSREELLVERSGDEFVFSAALLHRVSMEEELHVLAVDDNLIDLTTAENGIRALEYLGLGDPQQTDSPSTNNVIKQESSNLKEVPVVILSSENIPTRINKCFASGAQMFMQKPLKLSDVEKLKCHLLNCRS
ncbi:hypothetical protein Bca4012_095428 [Brassica carinata]